MTEDQRPIEQAESARRAPDYRDELNFAEFPLATLSDKPSESVKTLVFSDQIFDKGKRQMVPRKLTVSASDEFGLPTPLDEEVLLGLIQLSHQKQFDGPIVHFSRYSLIKLLGWRDDTKSYRRIEESLKRWVGVTLYYDRAWWSREEQCWVNENFHVINQVTIFDRERRERRKNADPDNPHAGLSSIVWSDPVFKSFKAGNLKPLNLEIYTSFRTAIAKRMFRFLDKRFHFRERLDFDLREFACEHIGITKGCPTSEIRRRLRSAIDELVTAQFIAPMADEERYIKEARGLWRVHFTKPAGRRIKLEAQTGATSTLQDELRTRGVTTKTARTIVARFAEDLIREKIKLLDWMNTTGKAKEIVNPAGFLVKAITEDYTLPKGFQNSSPSKGTPRMNVPTKGESTEKETDEDRKSAAELANLNLFLASLSDRERKAFESDALELTDNILLRREYVAGKELGGMLFRTVQERILLEHFRRRAKTAAPRN